MNFIVFVALGEGVKGLNIKQTKLHIRKVTLAVIRFVFNSLYQRPHRVRKCDLNPLKRKAS